MSQSNAEEQELDFSIIDKQNPQQNPFDSSLQSILTQQQQKSSSKNRNTGKTGIENFDSLAEKKDALANGSFLKDLEKLQEELSYQSKSFNVYDPSFSQSDVLNPVQKQPSNNLVYIQGEQFNFSKRNQVYQEKGYQHLVIDFTQVGKQVTNPLTFLQRLKLERLHRKNEHQYIKPKYSKPIKLFSTQSCQRLSFNARRSVKIDSKIYEQKNAEDRQFRWSSQNRDRIYKSVSAQRCLSRTDGKEIGIINYRSRRNCFENQRSKQRSIFHQYYGSYMQPNKHKNSIIQTKKKSFKVDSVEKRSIPKLIQGQTLKFKAIKHKKTNLNTKKRS